MNPVSILVLIGAVLCSVDKATGQSLAFVSVGKPAFQTSTLGDAEASRANDDDANTNFAGGSCSSTAIGTENPTWWVDLGESLKIYSLQIFRPMDSGRSYQGDVINPFRIHIGESTDVLTNDQCGGDNTIPAGQSNTLVYCSKWGRYVAITLPGSSRTLQLCEVVIRARLCPSGFNNRLGFNKCLKVYGAPKNYADATLECGEYSAKLFLIDSDDKTQRLKARMAAYRARTGRKRGVWIGLTDTETEGAFKWDKYSGYPLGAYTDWADGALDMNTIDRSCVQMKAAKDWQWWIVDCQDRNAYICHFSITT